MHKGERVIVGRARSQDQRGSTMSTTRFALKRVAEAREVAPYRSGLKKEANGCGANKAAPLNGPAGSSPENRDRSQDLESPWGGIVKASLALCDPSHASLSDIRR